MGSFLIVYFHLLAGMAESPTVQATTRFSESFSDPRNSMSWETEMSVRVWKRNQVWAFANFERRDFAGVVALKDVQVGGGTTLVPSQSFYLELASAHTPQANFLPRWEVRGEPHFVFKSLDGGLGARWRVYRAVKTFSLRPSLSWEASSFLRLGGFVDVSLKPKRTVSGGMSANVTWVQSIETRLSLSGGKSDEGDGIYDDFTDIHLGFVFPLVESVQLGVDGGFRMSELRDELSYGVSLRGGF